MLAERETDKFPVQAAALFRPAAYKVMHGGRGGAKSWAAARALLLLAARKKLFILCAREIQKSISESVYKLLCDQIEAMGLGDIYLIQSRDITCTKTGSRFVFAGVRNNITAIKSMEAIDVCWIEEAEKVSGNSWSVLLPTIRRDPPHGPFGRGSEVWVVFNPELSTDFTYKYWVLDPPQPVHRFKVNFAPMLDDDGRPLFDEKTGKPLRFPLLDEAHEKMRQAKPRTVLMEMNYWDNPWFPRELELQKDDLKKRDYESYLTVWKGQVRRIVKGAIYAKELEAAQRDRRISPNITVDRSRPVDISVDLGRSDMTSLWFWQQEGLNHYAVDFYENFGYDWSHYLEQIQSRKYIIGRIYLPHDARNQRVEAAKSIYSQTRDFYPGSGQVAVVTRTPSVANDISAVRQIFGRLFFNEITCSAGLHALAHYRYEIDPEDPLDISKDPLHDWSSHAADALRCYVMGLKGHAKQRQQMHIPYDPIRSDTPGTGWMQL